MPLAFWVKAAAIALRILGRWRFLHQRIAPDLDHRQRHRRPGGLRVFQQPAQVNLVPLPEGGSRSTSSASSTTTSMSHGEGRCIAE
jgi:hypothetical protein